MNDVTSVYTTDHEKMLAIRSDDELDEFKIKEILAVAEKNITDYISINNYSKAISTNVFF